MYSEIDLLKVGLPGIAKRYGFHTVHDFYKTYASVNNAYAKYQEKADKVRGILWRKYTKAGKRKRIQTVTELSKGKFRTTDEADFQKQEKGAR